MKHFRKEKDLLGFTFSISCSGDWNEFGLGCYIDFDTSRIVVTDDLKHKGMWVLAGLHLLWMRLHLSRLFMLQPRNDP